MVPGKTGLTHCFLQPPGQHSTEQHFVPSTQSPSDEHSSLELCCVHLGDVMAAGHTLLSGTSVINTLQKIQCNMFLILFYLNGPNGNHLGKMGSLFDHCHH